MAPPPFGARRTQAIVLALFTIAALVAMIVTGVVQTEAGQEAARWLGF